MAESISSIIGGGGTSVMPDSASPKKKLKKVGDYWVDEQGNQYADEAGTQPIKDMAKNTGSAMDFFNQLKEDPNARGNLFTGEVSKQPISAMQEKPQDQGPPDDEGDKLFEKYQKVITQDYGLSKAEWRKKWAQWDAQGRQKTKEMLAKGDQ